MKLIPLGANGYLPINGRHSSCFLVLTERAAILLDAGTGAARLHEPAIRAHLEGRTDLHVLLSHYHVDHTAGLYYAFTAWRHGPLHVHAPVCPYVQCDPAEAIGRYFAPPLNSYRLTDSTIRIHPVNQPVFDMAGHRIAVWPQRHPGGSVGYRIDDALVYATDTVVMMENVGHAAGVDLLLHELWLNDADAAADEKENQRHACFGPVAAFVKEARPRRVMPIHLYPHYSDAEIATMTQALADHAGVPVEVPVEGRVYDIVRRGIG